MHNNAHSKWVRILFFIPNFCPSKLSLSATLFLVYLYDLIQALEKHFYVQAFVGDVLFWDVFTHHGWSPLAFNRPFSLLECGARSGGWPSAFESAKQLTLTTCETWKSFSCNCWTPVSPSLALPLFGVLHWCFSFLGLSPPKDACCMHVLDLCINRMCAIYSVLHPRFAATPVKAIFLPVSSMVWVLGWDLSLWKAFEIPLLGLACG